MAIVWMPPTNVEVAVVVATIEPTVTCELVAATLAPSNQRSAEERRVALVPPFAMPKVPVMSFARSIKALVTAPFVAFKNPVSPVPSVSPPLWMFKPPAKVEVAVLVASMVPVWRRSSWNPEVSEVEVAVVVETTRCSMTAVEDAMSPYFALVTLRKSAVEVAATD